MTYLKIKELRENKCTGEEREEKTYTMRIDAEGVLD